MSTLPINSYILKVAARCNLDCSYCYVFNKSDATWKDRPGTMSDAIFETTLHRIAEHCSRSGQKSVRINFHGGEPLLIGCDRFSRWCAAINDLLSPDVTVGVSVQTNGTLLTRGWINVLLEHDVSVGISLDGPRDIHNSQRVDRKGRGSYDQVERALKLLQDTGVPHRVLTVIQPGECGLSVHRHLLSLGCRSITYIMPDYTHEEICEVRSKYGQTPCADFLIPVFDDWWFHQTLEVVIRDLWNMAKIIVGGRSEIETFGRVAPAYAFIETDGSIEGLDCLRSCDDGLTRSSLNVRHNDFHDLTVSRSTPHRAIFDPLPIPTACIGCPEEVTCAGGYLPHRYSRVRGFDNPSVWCADIIKLFSHIRDRLEISPEDTDQYRAEFSAVSPT